jgi:hypothetical protein
MRTRACLAIGLLVTTGCDRPDGDVPPTCGVAALAAATKILEQFTVPNQTLAAPPATLPERTVARVIADGAFPAVVGRTDTLLILGVEGNPPASVKPGFGVLVVDREEKVLGVAIYEGQPIPGAPKLGQVSIGGATVPLIGVQADPGQISDPNCPSLFPDSMIR